METSGKKLCIPSLHKCLEPRVDIERERESRGKSDKLHIVIITCEEAGKHQKTFMK